MQELITDVKELRGQTDDHILTLKLFIFEKQLEGVDAKNRLCIYFFGFQI